MRALSLLLLTLLAISANAEERTWTISTGTYTVAAELLEVRGDIAYLKIRDSIEHVPLARLSGADQLYITLQSRPMVLPGPVEESEERVTEESLPGPRTDFTPFPPTGAVVDRQQGPARNITVNKPLMEPELIPPGQVSTPVRSNANYVEELPPAQASFEGPPTRSLLVNPRSTTNTNPNKVNSNNKSTANKSSANARKTAQQPNQNKNTANQNRSRDDDRRGLLGGRARRLNNDR